MTECNQEVFSFASHFSRRVEASFTAGQVSTDGGALLLRQADGKIGLLKRVASCFTDRRSPLLVEHQLVEMLSQRIYGLALGYEDLCDHEQLRHDPLMAVLAGRRRLDAPLAGKSTLNRLELPGGSKRYHKIDYAPEKIDALLCDLFIESHAESPEQIVLDLDATDIPLHGHQPERFFHGYYDSYCYLPLYIFALTGRSSCAPSSPTRMALCFRTSSSTPGCWWTRSAAPPWFPAVPCSTMGRSRSSM